MGLFQKKVKSIAEFENKGEEKCELTVPASFEEVASVIDNTLASMDTTPLHDFDMYQKLENLFDETDDTASVNTTRLIAYEMPEETKGLKVRYSIYERGIQEFGDYNECEIYVLLAGVFNETKVSISQPEGYNEHTKMMVQKVFKALEQLGGTGSGI